jgi:hypothetical protein
MTRLLAAGALLLVVACQSNTGSQEGNADSSDPSNTSQAVSAMVTTQLAVDLFRNGQAVVAAATVIPGSVTLNTMVTSEFAYEVQSGGKVISAEPLPGLHEQRGIARPGTVEEYRGVQDSTRVLIYVPGKSTTDDDYDVVVHRLSNIPAGQRLAAGNFAATAQANGASVFARLSGKSIAARAAQLKKAAP